MSLRIAVNGATVAYDAAPVLDGLTLQVAPGEWLGVVGPNGCGKTTLLRTLAGVLRPRGGTVLLDETPSSRLAPVRLARRLATVGAWPLPEFPFTAAEYVMLGRLPYQSAWGGDAPEDWRLVERALERTGSVHLAGRPLRELSSGERQRVVLARALAQQPRVLLLDEPTAHLDLRYQLGVMDLLERLRRSEGLTLISVMHDLNLAALYCDRLALMAGGRVRVAGTPWTVLQAELVEEVFGCRVRVTSHPTRRAPQVALLPRGDALPDAEAAAARSLRAPGPSGEGRTGGEGDT